METTYFVLGMLSVVALIFIGVIAWGMVKISKQQTEIESLQENIQGLFRTISQEIEDTTRRIDSERRYIQSEVREIKLTRVKPQNIRKLQKFFAQCDVDVITNYPRPGCIPSEESGYGINTYPYYTLAYYANGKNYLIGLIKKIRTNDKELLTKLRAL